MVSFDTTVAAAPKTRLQKYDGTRGVLLAQLFNVPFQYFPAWSINVLDEREPSADVINLRQRASFRNRQAKPIDLRTNHPQTPAANSDPTFTYQEAGNPPCATEPYNTRLPFVYPETFTLNYFLDLPIRSHQLLRRERRKSQIIGVPREDKPHPSYVALQSDI
jgi:hypothetical protein